MRQILRISATKMGMELVLLAAVACGASPANTTSGAGAPSGGGGDGGTQADGSPSGGGPDGGTTGPDGSAPPPNHDAGSITSSCPPGKVLLGVAHTTLVQSGNYLHTPRTPLQPRISTATAKPI
jgi:hypothetical protein